MRSLVGGILALVMVATATVADAQPTPASQPRGGATASQPASAPAPGAGPGHGPWAALDQTGALPPRGPGAERDPSGGAAPQPAVTKRPVPSYDGREPPGASAGDVLLWIPRLALLPIHVVLEYGLRWPLVKLMTVAEEHYVIQRAVDLFTFRDGRAGLFPTAFFDFGLSPSVGLYFFHDDLGVNGNDLVIQTGVWFEGGWFRIMGKDTFPVFRDDSGKVTLRAEHRYQPDFVFNGLGPGPHADPYFYRLRQTAVDVSLRGTLQGLSRASVGVAYRNSRITGGRWTSVDAPASPFVGDLAATVPGFGETYNLVAGTLKLELDSRSPERVFTPGTGLRLELFTSLAADPGDPDLSFVRYGGEVAGFLDLSGVNHVLALRFHVELLEPLGDRVVPISERLTLGGDEHLRGFLEGWFHGDSAAVTTLEYRYPIHPFLDASLFSSLGSVFHGRFQGFGARDLSMSWGVGVRSNTSREVSFDLMLAFGSNPIGQWTDDFNLDHLRIVAGINQGF